MWAGRIESASASASASAKTSMVGAVILAISSRQS
jgi:hypothetical protein